MTGANLILKARCYFLNHPNKRLKGSGRAQYEVRIFLSKMPISSPNPAFEHLLESSHNRLGPHYEVRIFISKMPISSPNPMFEHLLESSLFSEEITQVVST